MFSAFVNPWNEQQAARPAGEVEELSAQAPQPVAVSERLPKPKDCDAEGSCWLWTADDVDGVGQWSYCHRDWAQEGDVTHWLPAHALPIPQQEES